MTRTADQARDDPPFALVGGRPSLNLVATLGRRHAAPVERIPDAAALARWFVAADLLPTAPPVSEAHLVQARQLREAISSLVRSVMSGSPMGGEPLAIVNGHAVRPDLPPQLAVEDGRTVVTTPPGADAPSALAAIARDAVRLLGGSQAARIKECEHPDCSLVFVDETQSGRRRWCSMGRCGNLVKTAGYRARRHRAG
ncbi:MAG TPA: ABATE domain-containing protein [Solirubrobacteraceae bacterium]|nr:ABATE domain-containing protein [Solirubrobacteraceae bacterium]